MQSGIFPSLETERLVLRRLSIDDAPEIFILRSDEKHNQYVDRPKAASLEDAKAFISKIETLVNSGESYFWVISVKPGTSLAGTVCLWNIDLEKNQAEIGYELLPSYQGKGIMSEAIKAILHFGFDQLKLRKLEAWPHPDNNKSTALLSKLGFCRDIEAEKHKPDDSAEVIYALKAAAHL